jgi:hypothetical protein
MNFLSDTKISKHIICGDRAWSGKKKHIKEIHIWGKITVKIGIQVISFAEGACTELLIF